jgi:DNA-directed RNA polymerase I, II, and III subunit RPABC1
MATSSDISSPSLVSLISPSEYSFLYKEKQAIKVILEMFIDREYKIDYADKEFTKEQPYIVKAKKNATTAIVFINEDDKLNIQGIKDKISIMNKENATSCIIIYKATVTSSAKKSLETLEYEFELFALHELQLNITRHRLVPRHTRVLQTEKEELDKSYKGKLPIILHTDPIARYYSFKRGEYVRITRKDGSIIYRIVK